MDSPYKRQNPYLAAIVFFVSKKKFIEIAVQHGMAVNLESEDRQKYIEERGSALILQWEERYRSDYSEMTHEISTALWSAFWTIIVVIVLALAIAAYFGSIGLTLEFDYPRLTGLIGSSLVAWGTLMELGGDFVVWDGKAFPQLAHTVIFKAIFVPGVFLVLTSMLL